MLGIIDYGVGNLASVSNAFAQVEVDAIICDRPREVSQFSHLVLPGVGSFACGMNALLTRGWVDEIKEAARNKKPILGICLGMQFFFDQSVEHGITAGLGLIPGEVLRLDHHQAVNRIPHVGWNNIEHHQSHPIFKDVKQHIDFYFVHSYCCVPSHPEHILATAHDGAAFVAAVACESIIGLQFHPEKSQPAGVRILKNFSEWDGGC